jgi:hypothetical protein
MFFVMCLRWTATPFSLMLQTDEPEGRSSTIIADVESKARQIEGLWSQVDHESDRSGSCMPRAPSWRQREPSTTSTTGTCRQQTHDSNTMSPERARRTRTPTWNGRGRLNPGPTSS